MTGWRGRIVGIDPGFSGAIAVLDSKGNLEIEDMPVSPNPKGKTELNLYSLMTTLKPRWDGPSVAVLELVSAMPGQGVSSVFRFGQSFGAIQAAVTGHGYETHYVTPAMWKKHFKLSRDKGVSRALAQQRFPAQADLFARVKDDGRAEAALIALWGAETLSASLRQSA